MFMYGKSLEILAKSTQTINDCSKNDKFTLFKQVLLSFLFMKGA